MKRLSLFNHEKRIAKIESNPLVFFWTLGATLSIGGYALLMAALLLR